MVLSGQEVSSNGLLAVTINQDLAHGQKFQFVIRCTNTIGLVSSRYSQMITMVRRAPAIDSASLEIIHEPKSFYPQRGNYISQTDSVWLKWHGIVDEVPVDHCEVRNDIETESV